jgi:hypothetical protein
MEKSATSNGLRTMKKICEIDDVEVFAEHGVKAWHNRWQDRRHKINPAWVEAAFTPAQRLFMQDRHIVFRPHPGYSPTIEVFIDESTLDSRDWTVLRLLF